MKNCLVIIDMQNDFISGTLGTKEAKAIVPHVKSEIENAISNGVDIFFTKDTHYENYLETMEGKKLPVKHCIKGTWGHDICDEIKPFEKNAKNIFIKETFGYKDLPKYLENYDNITFMGLCTDICVVSNVMLTKAFYPEKNIIVKKDCCAGVTIENHNSALAVMKSCHIDIL